MAIIKSYSDLQQSKKLAEILPLESADMYWSKCTITDFGNNALKVSYAVEPCNISQFRNTKEDVPCWSLAALLSVLDFPSLTQNKEDEWEVCVPNHQSDGYIEASASNPIDACYGMVLKLKEKNLL